MPLNVRTCDVSLPPKVEPFIDERVTSGRFRSASEVVRAALRLLEDEEHRQEMLLGKSNRGSGQLARPPGHSES